LHVSPLLIELILIIYSHPRPETESMTNHLASLLPSLLKSHESPHPHLRILDLCTGTGCISLLLHSLLSSPKIPPQVCGIDISSTAINLAQENLAHNIRLGHLEPIAQEQIDFIQDDIFSDSKKPWRTSSWDVIISNPPYISPNSFNNTTSRSVRNYEPKAALVPPQTVAADSVHDDTVGDMFYPRLLKIAHNANAKLVLMEVADMAQATRVVEMVLEKGIWGGCEIWRDEPSSNPRSMGERVVIRGRDVEVKGEGNGRGVLVWRKDRDISIH